MSYSKGSLQSHFIPLDALNCLGWDGSLAISQLWSHIDRLPLNWCLCLLLASIFKPLTSALYLGGSKDILHRLRDFGSDTVTLNQTDSI
jgi:hypothetical protein